MRRLLFRVLLLASTANFALHAQVDARLQACRTDVLDIYGGSRVAAKPEIITLIDRSGSTSGLAWDGRFYTNVNCNWHIGGLQKFYGYTWEWDQYSRSWKQVTALPTSDADRLSFTVVSDSTSYSGISYTVNLVGFYSYWNGSQWVQKESKRLGGGILIQPNGNPVTSGADAAAWVKQASHVRFAVTSLASSSSPAPSYTIGSTPYGIPAGNCGIQPAPLSGSVGSWTYNSSNASDIKTSDKIRVVDIPLPWTVFDRVARDEDGTNHKNNVGTLDTIANTSGNNLSTMKSEGHPQHLFLQDPVPSDTTKSQWYEIDNTWTGGIGINNTGGTFNGFDLTNDYLAWVFFGQDTKDASGTVQRYSGGNAGGYTIADARDGAVGFQTFTRDGVTWTGNGLPEMTRIQAIKYAVIKTYIAQQANVWWAIRFLNNCSDSNSNSWYENGRSGASKCFDSRNLFGSPGDRELLFLTPPTSAQEPGVNLRYIQSMNPFGNTPLTFALMNTYAQLASTDNGNSGSVFSDQKTENPVPSCRRSFVVVLSDGNPNDSTTQCDSGDGTALKAGDPYMASNLNGDSNQGDLGITFGMNTIAPAGSNFNIWSLSGLTAHMTPTEFTGSPTDNSGSVKPPFLITTRPSNTTRRISTMTIGVSMAGSLADTGGAKMAMYKTALYGWEARKSFKKSPLPAPYNSKDSSASNSAVNPYFFDAQSPDDIASALADAFDAARSVTNSMAAPVAPLSGLSVGNQMYFATFTSGTNDQAVWNGDLLMTGMKVVGNSVTLLHKNGTTILDTVNKDTAVWSAATVLDTKGWQNRTLFTLQPTNNTTSTTFTTTKLTWNEALGTSTSLLSNTQLGVTTAADRKSLVRFMLGASAAAQADANNAATDAGNRLDMMGDIINSTPLILEFPLAQVPTSGTLATFKSAHAASGSAPLSNMHFRLIIVGDNQGVLHGFGEVSGTDTAGILQAAMDELWGFIPPDVLSGLQTWRTGNRHRYLMDGSASLYLREAGTANGVIDGTDVCRVLVGLRKGGRSYYCFKFTSNNPSSPEVDWMVRPDDETTSTVIQKMGFSTSTPSSGRIQDGTTVKDVFFLGGGLSTSDVDTQFGTNVKLGRSVLAFRAAPTLTAGTTYELVKSWDYSADTTDKGSIPAAVVPVQVTLQKGKVERLYFGTAFGSVYCLGAKASSGARTDTADLSSWSLRTIFKSKDTTGQSMGSAPSIFRYAGGSYPVPLTRTSGSVTSTLGRVPFMGVAFGLGDRNDPMDMDSRNPSVTPYVHRFVVLLDRLDSADLKNSGGNAVDTYGFTEDDLTDLTAVADASNALITPSSTTYYLKSTCGYKLDFIRYLKDGSKTDYFYKKNVTTPVVLNGMLEFTAFSPNVKASVCGGSGGTSYAYTMCDVLNPVFMDNTTTVNTLSATTCSSGLAYKFNDIPSEAGTVGLSSIVVVGELINAETGKGSVDPAQLPPPPVTSLTRPRAWRIIR